MFKLSRVSLALAALACTSSAFAASVFNFDSDTVTKGTAFTDTNNGISATFSSSGDPNGFVVENLAANGLAFSSLSGNVLIDDLYNTKSQLTLSISFSSLLSSVSLNFAVQNQTPAPFLLQAFNNNTLVGSVTETDAVPPGFVFAEGIAAFSSSSFNEIVLSSTANAFAVDNITVTAGTVTASPEPGTVGLLSGSLLLSLFAVPRLRRRFA